VRECGFAPALSHSRTFSGGTGANARLPYLHGPRGAAREAFRAALRVTVPVSCAPPWGRTGLSHFR